MYEELMKEMRKISRKDLRDTKGELPAAPPDNRWVWCLCGFLAILVVFGYPAILVVPIVFIIRAALRARKARSG